MLTVVFLYIKLECLIKVYVCKTIDMMCLFKLKSRFLSPHTLQYYWARTMLEDKNWRNNDSIKILCSLGSGDVRTHIRKSGCCFLFLMSVWCIRAHRFQWKSCFHSAKAMKLSLKQAKTTRSSSLNIFLRIGKSVLDFCRFLSSLLIHIL